MNASTVATRFHAASRSTDSVIEPRPQTCRVEPVRDLRADEAGELEPARHPDLAAGQAGHQPVAVLCGRDAGVLRGRPRRRRRPRPWCVRRTRCPPRGRPAPSAGRCRRASRRRRGSGGCRRCSRSARRTSRRPRPRSAARRSRRRASRRPAAFSQTIRPVVHASSSTPAGDRRSSTSSSKRVREEPSGPTSPAPTITTMSSRDGCRCSPSPSSAG